MTSLLKKEIIRGSFQPWLGRSTPMLTATRIEKLAKGKNVKTVAVENFLGTLGDMTYQEALSNVEMDARSYRWSRETVAAIRKGLTEHYFSE